MGGYLNVWTGKIQQGVPVLEIQPGIYRMLVEYKIIFLKTTTGLHGYMYRGDTTELKKNKNEKKERK